MRIKTSTRGYCLDISQSNIQRNVQKLEERITNQILGVKGLNNKVPFDIHLFCSRFSQLLMETKKERKDG